MLKTVVTHADFFVLCKRVLMLCIFIVGLCLIINFRTSTI